MNSSATFLAFFGVCVLPAAACQSQGGAKRASWHSLNGKKSTFFLCSLPYEAKSDVPRQYLSFSVQQGNWMFFWLPAADHCVQFYLTGCSEDWLKSDIHWDWPQKWKYGKQFYIKYTSFLTHPFILSSKTQKDLKWRIWKSWWEPCWIIMNYT